MIQLVFQEKKPKSENLSFGKMPRGKHKSMNLYQSKTGAGFTQRVTVKINYTGAKKLQGTVDYITKDGKGVDGKKPEIFTEQGKEPNLNAIDGEERYFRVVISPDKNVPNMKEYVQDVMKEAEKVTGEKLQWFAAEHNNTEHKHAHVVIRGTTKDGHELYLDPRFISKTLRDISQDRATMELGQVSQKEMNLKRTNETKLEKMTSLDFAIDRNIQKNDGEEIAKAQTKYEKQRLDNLCKIGLAYKNVGKKDSYIMAEGWKDELKARGDQNKALENMSKIIGEPSNSRLRYHCNDTMTIKGRVVHRGEHNEYKNEDFVIVKGEKKKENEPDKYYYFSAKDKDMKGLDIGSDVSISKGKIQDFSVTKDLNKEATAELDNSLKTGTKKGQSKSRNNGGLQR